MVKKFLPVLFLSACATSTLFAVIKTQFFVNNPTGDAPVGTYEMSCEEYKTENDPTSLLATGTQNRVLPHYYSARCTVEISGRSYQCFYDTYDEQRINGSVMENSCRAFVEKWTRPVLQSDDGGGYSPP